MKLSVGNLIKKANACSVVRGERINQKRSKPVKPDNLPVRDNLSGQSWCRQAGGKCFGVPKRYLVEETLIVRVNE